MNRARLIFAYAVLVVCLPTVIVLSQFTSSTHFEQRFTTLTAVLALVIFLNVMFITVIGGVVEVRARRTQQPPLKQPIYIQDYLPPAYSGKRTSVRGMNQRR